jgi:hypothetical protein
MGRRLFGLLGVITLIIGGATALPIVQARQAAATPAGGYAAIRRYHVKAGSTGEIVRRARAGFLPIISATPGFRAWYLVDTGNDTLVAVSLFNDRAGAEASTQRAADWIKKNLAEFMPNPPEISQGSVVVQKVR